MLLLTSVALSAVPSSVLTDYDRLHKRVMSWFGPLEDPARATGGVLFRVERDFSRVLVQSQVPLRDEILARSSVRCVTAPATPAAGHLVDYRIVANPVRCTSRTGRRVALRDDDALDWWSQRAARVGLELLGPLPGHLYDESRARSQSRQTPLALAEFRGRAAVTDVAALDAARAAGIGRSLAFGCGLLSVREMSPASVRS